MAIDDSMQARITTTCPEPTREILLHAWSHDVPSLKALLDTPGKSSSQDPETGETPLHAAIRACGPASGEDGDDDLTLDEAQKTLETLFLRGAIWNDVDSNNETPGCVAHRLGQKTLYRLCMEAGVRAELLFGLMDGYEELSSGDEMDEDEVEEEANGEEATAQEDAAEPAAPETEEKKFVPPAVADPDVKSDDYLRSTLTYTDGKLVDDRDNGVMMAWETDIMRRSVDALLPPGTSTSGKRILNVGFGMGIVDGMFAATKPARHHVIEAHPEVLAHIDTSPECAFGAAWEASGPEEGAFKIHRGRWQDVVPKLLEAGEVYDAIYFDTFGEDYAQLKLFFTEYVPGLLDGEGRFGFFNGLGADRRICYDVYTKVVEMHMADAGMDVEWDEIDVDMKGMEEAGKGEWEGVKRRYWTLDKYRLPTCTFMG
ncbi:arginine n-methyltransferase 2 [Colletotrichum plurivorum]|uniref:Arginine N-methyltransferase 2 n=1 Tax=Colletotrichum plurivorum TaxID=2175906 RepID=A0A8H6NR74_9PEZI|nr:arginine n-methyltransferase 2 [Colletotrichum plurivorum]